MDGKPLAISIFFSDIFDFVFGLVRFGGGGKHEK